MMAKIKLFATDDQGNKEEITDLYWFEEKGFHNFGKDDGFMMSIDGGEEFEIESGTPFGRTDKARAYYPLDGNIPIYQAFGHGGPRNPHVGVDFAVRVGTPVRAVLDGTVIECPLDSRTYGCYVLILHPDGCATLYAHLSKLLVKKGGAVHAGDVIGLSGGAIGGFGSGQTTGPHLHFEARPEGHTDTNRFNIDPMRYVESYM
jgi:murein DD-endopeptidase MepM/ murein hydrolase activator NlpD